MKQFYAYIYRDPSRVWRGAAEPFYVGKGTGNRCYIHLSRKDMHPLVQRIQKMRRAGVEPCIETITAIDESHALFLEKTLVQVIGRKCVNGGPLLNLTEGGEGITGWKASPEQLANRKAKWTLEKRQAMSEKKKLQMSDPALRAKCGASVKRALDNPESRMKMSQKARSRERLQCAYCDRKITPQNMKKHVRFRHTEGLL